MIMIYMIEILMSYIENICGLLLINKFAGNQNGSWIKTAAASMFLTAIVSILNQASIFSLATTVIGLMLMSICASVIYRIKLIDSIPLAGTYMLIVYIIDFSLISFLGTIFQNPQFAMLVTNGYSIWRKGFMFLSKTEMIILTALCIRLKPMKIKVIYTWIIFIVGILIVYLPLNYTFFMSGLYALIFWILLLAIIILGVYSIIQHMIVSLQKKQAEFAEEKNLMLMENYKILADNYQDNQKFYHDIKNQYLILKQYLETTEYVKANEYMEKLIKEERNIEMINYTGVDAIDILLAYKRNLANLHSINMSIIGERIPDYIPDYKMAALLGNLLDNAIENCQNLELDRKWIQVIIRKVGEISLIKITNPYLQAPQSMDGKLITRKENKQMHGIGLKSAEETVGQYGGTITYEYTDGKFCVVVSFFD